MMCTKDKKKQNVEKKDKERWSKLIKLGNNIIH